MAFEEEEKYIQSLKRIKKACKVIHRILWLMIIAVTAFFSCAIILGIISVVSPHAISFIDHVDTFSLFALGIFGLITFFVFRNSILVLSDVLSDEPPFTIKQAKRIRNISYLLFTKVIVDLLVPTRVIPVDADYISFSFEIIESPALLININTEALVMALLFFCMSLIFRYGVLLQKDTQGFF